MHDLLIEGGAEGGWKTEVPLECGETTGVADDRFGNRIQFEGADTRPDRLADGIEGLTAQTSGGAHCVDFARRLEGDVPADDCF